MSRERDANRGDRMPIKTGQMREVVIPRADSDWHPIAKKMWESLKQSGQADFFQQSDWAFAYSLMEDLSYYKKGVKRSGQMLATIMSALERLLVTEADRRRARVELTKPDAGEPDKATVTVIQGYKEGLGL